MARTAITVQALLKPFDNVAAGDLDITFAAGDGSLGNSYAVTGKELLLAYNDGTAAKTITIDSVDDEKNREDDITDYSLAVGDYIAFTGGLTNSKGWKQSGGTINIDVEDSDVLVAVLRLP
jgi:hypothetical protein